jgi:hypothetical protein
VLNEDPASAKLAGWKIINYYQRSQAGRNAKQAEAAHPQFEENAMGELPARVPVRECVKDVFHRGFPMMLVFSPISRIHRIYWLQRERSSWIGGIKKAFEQSNYK